MALNRALVVDDSRLARVALSKLLTRRGLEVDVAGSGGEALDHLRHAVPDVVFLDYMMPDMDGFEAAQAIQALPGCPPVPLVMYTSQDSDNDRIRAREIGICGFLSKPTSEDGLDHVLHQVQSWEPPVAAAPSATPETQPSSPVGPDSVEPPAPAPSPMGSTDPDPEPAWQPDPEPAPTPVDEPEPEDVSGHRRPEPVVPAETPVSAEPEPTADSAAVPPPAPEVDVAAIERRAEEAARSAATDAVGARLDEASIHWQHQLDRMGAELRESLREELAGGASVTPEDLDQRLDTLREELTVSRREVVREATEAARSAAQQAVAEVSASLQQEAQQVARSAAEQAVQAGLAHQEAQASGDDELTEQVDSLLAQRLEGLADSEVFREQLIASLNDHGVPVLKNALDQWVRDRAAEAATSAVESAVESASEAMLREAAAAAAEEAAAEAHAAHARMRRFTLVGGLVLAVGVLAALLLAV